MIREDRIMVGIEMSNGMSSRFVRPVVVQVGRQERKRVIFDVNDAAAILLRRFPHQTTKRKLAMDAGSARSSSDAGCETGLRCSGIRSQNPMQRLRSKLASMASNATGKN